MRVPSHPRRGPSRPASRLIALALLFLYPLLALLSGAARAQIVVTVATEYDAHESGPTPGVFRASRTGDTSRPLTATYDLAGTAGRSDYMVWENLEFPAGSDTAYVAILPRNDALSEGDETVILTLRAGEGYVLGAPSSATVAIGDAHVPGFDGVFDTADVSPSGGKPFIDGDIRYMDAVFAGGDLQVDLYTAGPLGLIHSYDLYIDADHDPVTGDYRKGRLAGQEFRVNVDPALTGQYFLYRLRTEPPADPTTEDPRSDILLGSGPVQADVGGGYVRVPVPLAALGNPAAVDVFAVSTTGMNTTTPGDGDRCPDYGALYTGTGDVTVRRPLRTRFARITDPPGDAMEGGFDLTGMTLVCLADQVALGLNFTQGFDPTDPAYGPGPMGAVTLDSDRDLLTGDFGVGAPVPTFGGDALFVYSVGSVMLPSTMFYVQTDADRSKVWLGGNENDGWWRVDSSEKSLYVGASSSVVDPFRKVLTEAGTVPHRLASEGPMAASAETWLNLDVADTVPARSHMLDTESGGVAPPLPWEPEATLSVPDPLDFGGLAGTDWTLAEARILDGNLLVRGTMAGWINTEYGNRLDVMLDTDMDATTGESVANDMNGGPPIGADWVYSVHSIRMAQDASVGYFANLTRTGGETTRHDATVNVFVQSAFGVPGGFTATIPLRALGNIGTHLRLYLRNSYFLGPVGDIAPPQPMVLALTSITLPDVALALRIGAGLAPATAEDMLTLDTVLDGGITVTDAVALARSLAGLNGAF